jgi:hypothetical protein
MIMIKGMKFKLLGLALILCAGLGSLYAGGWSHQTMAGQGSYSAYVTVPAGTQCLQMAYTYGGPPCQVINQGPLGTINNTQLDTTLYLPSNGIAGPIAAGTYYIYQYVYTYINRTGGSIGGVTVTVLTW